MSRDNHLTDCGLEGIRWIPYGLHGCHVYDGLTALAQSTVDFFMAGLYLGEKCIWIAAPPLPAAQAREALAATWPGCAQAIAAGALRIVDFDAWWRADDGVDPVRLASALLYEEEQALREGYRALRVAMNTASLDPSEHVAFHTFERLVTASVRDRKLVALCGYDRQSRSGPRMGDIEHLHHCTFVHGVDGWEIQWPDAESALATRA